MSRVSVYPSIVVGMHENRDKVPEVEVTYDPVGLPSLTIKVDEEPLLSFYGATPGQTLAVVTALWDQLGQIIEGAGKPVIVPGRVRVFRGFGNSVHEAQQSVDGGWFMSTGTHRYGWWTDEMLNEAIAAGRLVES